MRKMRNLRILTILTILTQIFIVKQREKKGNMFLIDEKEPHVATLLFL